MPPKASFSTYIPFKAVTSSTTAYTGSATVCVTDTIDSKIKDYEEKLDKHVDELEEDIEFLDNMRVTQSDQIADLQANLRDANARLNSQEALINNLRNEVDQFKGIIRWLEANVTNLLEGKKCDNVS